MIEKVPFVRRRLERATSFLEEAADAFDDVPDRGRSSLARQAFLVTLDPGTGRAHPMQHFRVAAAVLVELWAEGRITVTDVERSARVAVRDPSPLGNHELDAALLSIGASVLSTKIKHRAEGVGVAARHYIRDDLEQAGAATVEQHRTLLAGKERRVRLVSTTERDEVVRRLHDVLTGASVPDERTELLVASLTVGGSLPALVPKAERRAADRRARELRAGAPAEARAIFSRVGEAALRD